jgi:hypothetical protein
MPLPDQSPEPLYEDGDDAAAREALSDRLDRALYEHLEKQDAERRERMQDEYRTGLDKTGPEWENDPDDMLSAAAYAAGFGACGYFAGV